MQNSEAFLETPEPPQGRLTQPDDNIEDSRDLSESSSDDELTGQVEKAIAEAMGREGKAQTALKPESLPQEDDEENEVLKSCALDIAALRQTTGRIAGPSVPIQYQPLQFQFSDELLLQQLEKQKLQSTLPSEPMEVAEVPELEEAADESEPIPPPGIRKSKEHQQSAQPSDQQEPASAVSAFAEKNEAMNKPEDVKTTKPRSPLKPMETPPQAEAKKPGLSSLNKQPQVAKSRQFPPNQGKRSQPDKATEKRHKDDEMKRILEEMQMLEEDELSRRLQQADRRTKLQPYANPLPKSRLLEFVAKSDTAFYLPLALPETQKLAAPDADENFLKYAIQTPARLNLKSLQALFAPPSLPSTGASAVPSSRPTSTSTPNNVVPSPSASAADTPSSVPTKGTGSIRQETKERSAERQQAEVLLAYLRSDNSLHTLQPVPQLRKAKDNSAGVLASTISLSNVYKDVGCECWAEHLLMTDFAGHNKTVAVSFPSFAEYGKNWHYTINQVRTKDAQKRKRNKTQKQTRSQASSAQDVEAEQLAELAEMVEVNELSLFDTLPKTAEEIEIKLENVLDLQRISGFSKLKRLTLPMNQLVSLAPITSLENLRELYLSQNKIARIDPTAFSRLSELRILHLDVNLIEKIEGLEGCRKLETLKLDNNRIRAIDNLAKCRELTHLHLYRNQIGQIGGLEQLWKLQTLDLGRNKLLSADYLESPSICPMLSELLLYYNEITTFPHGFSKLLLKALWLNGNKLQHFALGWCPLLDSLTISDNSIALLESLEMAPCLRSLDVSFNNLRDVELLFHSVKHNTALINLKFNDNPVEKGRPGSLSSLLVRLLPSLKEITLNSLS